jgi:hypothetical protein
LAQFPTWKSQIQADDEQVKKGVQALQNWQGLKRTPMSGWSPLISDSKISLYEAINRHATNIVMYNVLLEIDANIASYLGMENIAILWGNSNEGDHDINGFDLNDVQILGVEVFNVAESYLNTKLSSSRKKLAKNKGLKYRILACNHKVKNKGLYEYILVNGDTVA